jgi:type I restriction enzyme M protein
VAARQLFCSTPIGLPVVHRGIRKTAVSGPPGQTLFIDARKLGYLIDRVHRELTDEEVAKIAGTYHA